MSSVPLNTSRQVIIQQPMVNSYELEWLFLHILRVPAIFSEARRMLTSDLFNASEAHFSTLWRTLQAMYEARTPLTHQSIYYALQSQVANDMHRELTQAQTAALLRPDRDGLLFLAFDIADSEFTPNKARSILQQFLSERSVMGPLKTILQEGGHRTGVANFRGVITAAMSALQSIATISEVPVGKGMPAIGTALPAPDICEPTTLSFMDPWILGQRKGDLNGILGVSGSGKSTIGGQIAIANARNYYSQYTGAPGQKRRLAVFMSYEEPEWKINSRIWSCAADIRRQKLEAVIETRNWGLLSTQDTIESYERDLPGNSGANGIPILSETDRWNLCRTWLNEHFVLLDMSGADAHPDAGRGYVPEIRAALDRLVSERNAEIGTVVIDYAGLVCRRFMQANNIEEDKIRHKIATIGDQLRTEVTGPLGATGWLMHQLAGAQNKFSSTKLLSHADASESKSFAENMAVCGCLGTRDQASGVLMLNWSKVRYNRNPDTHMPRIRINGDFSRMDDVSDQLVLAESGGGFVDPATRNALGGHAPTMSTRPRTIDRVNTSVE